MSFVSRRNIHAPLHTNSSTTSNLLSEIKCRRIQNSLGLCNFYLCQFCLVGVSVIRATWIFSLNMKFLQPKPITYHNDIFLLVKISATMRVFTKFLHCFLFIYRVYSSALNAAIIKYMNWKIYKNDYCKCLNSVRLALFMPAPLGGGIKQRCWLTSDVCLSSVCLSVCMSVCRLHREYSWRPQLLEARRAGRCRRKACMGCSWAAPCAGAGAYSAASRTAC